MEEFEMSGEPKMSLKMIIHILNNFSEQIESVIDSDLVYFKGQITSQTATALHDVIKETSQKGRKNGRLAMILNSSGGEPDKVYRLVDAIRAFYSENVMFIIPTYAISAGTLLALSGDEIYLTKSSGLGSIDIQIEQGAGDYIPFSIYKELQQQMQLPEPEKEKFLKDIKYYKYLQEQNGAIHMASRYLINHLFSKEDLTIEQKTKIEKIPSQLADPIFLKELGILNHSQPILLDKLKEMGLSVIKDYEEVFPKETVKFIHEYHEVNKEFSLIKQWHDEISIYSRIAAENIPNFIRRASV